MSDTRDKTLTILAPAKVNLYLHVTGRRGDGYHELDSLVAFADIGDKLRIRQSSSFIFSVDGTFARSFRAADLSGERSSGNLAVRAAYGLADLLKRDPAVDIRLTKNLPLAAGLGGGSSDAAAVLWGLLEWWDVAPSAIPGFEKLLLDLGADVPACLSSQPVRVRGIGEHVSPVDGLEEMPVVLVNPARPCPTPDVFKGFGGSFTAAASEWHGGDLHAYLKEKRNDLEAPAITIVPEIKNVLEFIGRQAGCKIARMSGSGATCFGLFENELESLDAAEQISRARPGWWVRAGTLNRIQRY